MQHLDPTDPRRIGPYTLLGRLGAGGMGTVYLGRSAGGRTVAVKVIRPELADDEQFRTRFRQEVAAARTVSGAFTAPVVDADPDGLQPWMATAFVPGLSLHKAVDARGPLPEAALGTLAAGIAEALAGIHAAGLIHRDLKPANVLLAADGPHVIDFGISRAADSTALTATGVVVGSPGFLSPEQALGEAVTPASDVFALGATLVYAASGRGAFGEGAAPALLFRVVSSAPDLSAVPASLREVVAACLEKRPEQRPTPHQVIATIERTSPAATVGSWLPAPLMADVLASARIVTDAPQPPAEAMPAPDSPWPPGHPPVGSGTDATGPSRRKLLLGLAGGAVAVAGGTVAAVLEFGGGKKGASSDGSGRQGVLAGPEAKPLWTATAVEAVTQLTAAKGQVLCGGINHVWSLDDAGHPKWAPVDLSNGSTTGVDFAAVADGRLYAYGILQHYEGGRLAAVDIESGHVDWDAAPSANDTTYRVVAAADGVAYLAGATLWEVDTSSRKTLAEYPWPNLDVALIPPTGSRWLFQSMSGSTVVRLQAFDIPRGGRPSPGWQHEIPNGSGLACLAQGRFVCTGKQLFALDPATGTQVWATTETGDFQQPAASPDGSLVFVADLNTFYAFDAATGALRWQTSPAPDGANNPITGGMAYREASRPQCADGNVYVLDGKSVLWALDPATGAVRWKYSGAQNGDPFKNVVVWSAGNGRVYLANPTAQTIVSLSATGH